MQTSRLFDSARVAAAITISLIIAIGIISLVSKEPLLALSYFLRGPVYSLAHIGNVIEMAIPLSFAGLSCAILFKSNLFNLGAEGLFFSSALLSAMLASQLPLPHVVSPLFITLCGGILGGLLGCIPCVLYLKWRTNMFVVSIMMNNILYGICMYLLNQNRDLTAYAIVSPPFLQSAKLAKLIPGTRIHWGLVILIVCCMFLTWFISKTKWGYEIRMMGINQHFARYSGMSIPGVMFLVHALAGFVAGVGGSVEILGMYNKFQWTVLPGYGLDGALVALLARSNPAMVPLAAVFLAYIRIGTDMMSRMSDVSAEMVSIVQSVIILLISSQLLLQGLKNRVLLKEAKANE